MADYDVIIIGGRIGGASLGIHLGRAGLRVLVLERATLPSLPNVPSCPNIHPNTVKALAEFGVHQSDYTDDTADMERVFLEIGGHFTAHFKTSDYLKFGRCMQGVDRARMDLALWNRLADHPSVTARQGFSVTRILQENGRAYGVEGHEGKNPSETFTADLIVGADGRFSLTAEQLGAQATYEETEHCSSAYYAYWENVAPYDDGPWNVFQVFTTLNGINVLMMPQPNKEIAVVLHFNPKYAEESDLSPQDFYLNELKKYPSIWRRLEGAQQVDKFYGMKRIGNGYRQAGGAGWALAGDAYHYKDPVDGQGIYDTLKTTRILADVITAWRAGEITWEAALERYEQEAKAITWPMFNYTLGRVRELHQNPPPPFIIKTMIRWLLTDPAYQFRYVCVTERSITPEEADPKKIMGGVILRGLRDDLFRKRRPSAKPAMAQA